LAVFAVKQARAARDTVNLFISKERARIQVEPDGIKLEDYKGGDELPINKTSVVGSKAANGGRVKTGQRM
jgi:hypothetical protein